MFFEEKIILSDAGVGDVEIQWRNSATSVFWEPEP